MIELGKIAYDAYGESRGWKTVGNGTMPQWDEQTEELRVAWRAAANAVEAIVRRDVIRDAAEGPPE